MGHSHHHDHHGHHCHHGSASGGSRGRLLFAFAVNLVFAALELVGGYMTNSVAILSNALHDFGDAFSMGMSWYLEGVSARRGDPTYSYGYRRFSVLGALLNSIVLVAGSVVILVRAVPRLFAPEPVSVDGMMGLALLGIAVNALAMWRVLKGRSLNERVIAWHLIEDVLGWVAVLVMSLSLRFWNLPILDPLLSILITLFVLSNVLRRLREALRVFLQAVPEAMQIREIETAIRQIPQVGGVHHTRLWTLDGQSHILTTHVVVAQGTTADQVVQTKNQIKDRLRAIAIHEATIEIEFESEICATPD